VDIRVDPNEVTWGDLEDLQSADLRTVREVLCRFAFDDEGEPMDQQTAFEELRTYPVAQVMGWAKTLGDAVAEAAVPPQTPARFGTGSPKGGRTHRAGSKS
jgi:hypothetical protein